MDLPGPFWQMGNDDSVLEDGLRDQDVAGVLVGVVAGGEDKDLFRVLFPVAAAEVRFREGVVQKGVQFFGVRYHMRGWLS